MNGEHYILEGKEPVAVELLVWAKWLETSHEARTVAKAEINEDVRVSTVFLGLDHSFGEGPLQIFETMIFGGEHDEDQWRYSTWAEAEAGHVAAVALAEQAAVSS